MLFSERLYQDTRPVHADYRPPSAATRWIACPGSVTVVPLYPNNDSDASIKGDLAHKLLENALLFNIKPDTSDPDMDMNIQRVLAWTVKQSEGCRLYAERKYDIPETGEWGTADITIVSPVKIHIADYKDGYVAVDVFYNHQLMTYLLGAIAEFGPRDEYAISVLQPNYNHVDGPFRTERITRDQVDAFRQEVQYAVASKYFKAGPHCKKTYCAHRGACATFQAWVKENGPGEGWHTSEINAITDSQLSTALDNADVLHGWRDELRKEAMRRLLHLDRTIHGYKIVKSRTNRDFAGEAGREECFKALLQIGYEVADLVDRKPFTVAGTTLYEQTPLTVAGVERMVKQKYKYFGNGKWKAIWDEYFRPHIREFSGSLTLERAIDGRPAHTRGSEFGSLLGTPKLPSQVI